MTLIKGKEFPQPPTKVKNWGHRKINLHVAYCILQHPHDKRGSAGGQDRTKGTFISCLIRKLAALVGELYPRHEKRTKNPAETTGSRYKIEILMSRTRKLKGLSAASLRLKTLYDNPYFSGLRICYRWDCI